MKKKIIVFGLGNDWNEWRSVIENEYEIVGVSDNNPDAGKNREGGGMSLSLLLISHCMHLIS